MDEYLGFHFRKPKQDTNRCQRPYTLFPLDVLSIKFIHEQIGKALLKIAVVMTLRVYTGPTLPLKVV